MNPIGMLLSFMIVVIHGSLVVDSVIQSELSNAMTFFLWQQHDVNLSLPVTPESLSWFLTHASPSKATSRDNCSKLTTFYLNKYAVNLDQSQLEKLCTSITSCPSPTKLTELYDKWKEGPTPSTGNAVTDLCPVLLAQSRIPSCGAEHEEPFEEAQETHHKLSRGLVWGLAFFSVTIISCTSLVGVLVVPFLSKSSYLSALNLLEGLAVGSLVASAIFHLIPQAFGLLENEEGKHDYLWKAFMIWVGVYLFYWSERIMNLISREPNEEDKIKMDRRDTLHPLENGVASHGPPGGYTPERKSSHASHHSHGEHATLEQRIRSASVNLARSPIISERQHSHSGHEHNIEGKKIATVAWMIIFGDGLHNFIDGLSIGAAFNESPLTGISICLAVVCEEFPHELGDFAVLIASGMSVKQAVGYNFLSACTCYLGMILGVVFGDIGPTYIFALAGGMFLYIALVDMMGELTAAVEAASKISTKRTLWILFLQNIGILIGVVCLFFLAKYSEFINFAQK